MVVKKEEDILKLASKENYTIGESGFLTKTEGSISGIGVYVGDKPEIFLLTKDNPYYSQVVPLKDKVLIFKLKDSKEADKVDFEARKADIKNRLLREKQQEALSKWLNELRSKAKIEINREAM